MRLSIEAFGETVVDRQLMRFADNLAVPEVAWHVIGTMLRAVTERQFDTEGHYASGGWKPLSAGRVAEKARLGLDPRILRATGALIESLTRRFDPQHIERPLSPQSLVFGTRVPYAIYHASTQPRTVMPYRPPVALRERDKILLVKELQRALLGLPPSPEFSMIRQVDPSHGGGSMGASLTGADSAGLSSLASDVGGER